MQKDECTINIKGEVVSYEDYYITIKDITLLSVDEYKRYKNTIPPKHFWWWLRSQGEEYDRAAIACGDGSLHTNYVDNSAICVRPVIVCEPIEIMPGTKINALGMTWTMLDGLLILCDESIGYSAFREDSDASDANNYEVSDVKKFIQNWATKEIMNEGETCHV